MAGMTQAVLVRANEHCNLDSFPLRFGFLLESDTKLTIKLHSSPKPGKHGVNRLVYDGEFQVPGKDTYVSGVFVVTQPADGSTPKLVTAWRHDENAEYYLSEVLKNLRKHGTIDSEWLLQKHEDYRAGRLRTHTDLINTLAKEKSESDVNAIRENTDSVVSQLKAEVDAATKRAAAEAERAAAEAERAAAEAERADAAESQLDSEKARADTNAQWVKILSAEVERYKKEKTLAESKGSTVNETTPDRLQAVDENIIYNNSPCTRLTFSNGDKWYMKTSTFDQDGKVTNKAKKLIGYRVKVTSWDPVGQPGRWSGQWYFRNVYLVEQ